MAIDANSLLAATVCYECNTPGEWQLLKLGLLRQILLANNPMADTSPNALIEAAKCYACHSPGLWQLFELALLQQIAGAGPVGGSGVGEVGNFPGGNPNGVITPVIVPAILLGDDGSLWWTKTANNNSWIELIAP